MDTASICLNKGDFSFRQWDVSKEPDILDGMGFASLERGCMHESEVLHAVQMPRLRGHSDPPVQYALTAAGEQHGPMVHWTLHGGHCMEANAWRAFFSSKRSFSTSTTVYFHLCMSHTIILHTSGHICTIFLGEQVKVIRSSEFYHEAQQSTAECGRGDLPTLIHTLVALLLLTAGGAA